MRKSILMPTGVLMLAAVLPVIHACTTNDGLGTGPGAQLETSVAAGNRDAVLSPVQNLQEDTLLAVQHDRQASQIPYAGVWAADAQGCALIDQAPYDSFAVITESTLRQFEEICTYVPEASEGKGHVLDATCVAEGETTTRKIRLEMANDQSLKLSNVEGNSASDLIRCRLSR